MSAHGSGPRCYDAHLIDVGRGFEAKDNANLQENAETSHKKKADKISKEQYLLQLPPHLADHHLSGDIHIHDLEYFGTRPFCQDWDLRYFLYYGLMPDGNGTKASVAGPAKRAEVAILHAVKALGSAQTNFAGGQGYYNFLTFIAPFFEGMPYEEIRQHDADVCLRDDPDDGCAGRAAGVLLRPALPRRPHALEGQALRLQG